MKIITYDEKSMLINKKRFILYGGEMHYFRISRDQWKDRLLKLKNAGFNFVSLYIPWNCHEPQKGKEIWDGDYDLEYLIKLCQEVGLYVIIKPGPFINAEWDCGGYPHWMLYNIKPQKVRRLNKEYLSYVEYWYKKVAKKIKPYLITHGGNVILFQIENEYDHLMELSGIYIPDDEAYKYLIKHYRISRDCGIDIPIFTNEGKLIRGTEIIDTRTYYPDIPWLWKWNFQYFDQKIKQAQEKQPDKPVFIMEMEAGWFTQFGFPEYDVPEKLILNIIKNCLAQGASLINVFLSVGGTTFPYWGCRGDIYGPPIPGRGTTTSYDFMAPIREWGEINEKKYYDIRRMGIFLKSFGELIYDTEFCNNVQFLKGAEGTKIVNKEKIISDTNFETYDQKVLVWERIGKNGGLIFLRNLDDEPKKVVVSYLSKDRIQEKLPVEGEFTLENYSTYLLPINIRIPNTDIKIKYSTSELLTYKQVDKKIFFILYGEKNTQGEILFEGELSFAKPIIGKFVKTKINGNTRFRYQHKDLQILQLLKNVYLLVTDNFFASRYYVGANTFLFSDIYYLKDFKETNRAVSLNIESKVNKTFTTQILLDKKPTKILVDNKPVRFKYNKETMIAEFSYKEDKLKHTFVKWGSNWRYTYGGREKEVNYNDSLWKEIKKPTSLENLGIYEHGYVWYRAVFNLPKNIEEAKLVLDTNGIDRARFYINGKFVWQGIGKAEVNITNHINLDTKNFLAICYENSYHTKGHPAEGPMIKFSGLQTPVVIKTKIGGKITEQKINRYKLKLNFDEMTKGYFLTNYNDSSWKELPDAEKYVFKDSDFVWLRRKFLYLDKQGYIAPLGIVITELDERCLIYLNNKLIGKYESIGPQKKFFIPKNLLKKENLLCLFIESSGNKSAMVKEIKIEPYYIAKERKVVIYK